MIVLVCEDDQLIRQGLVALLEDEGYQVLQAKDGREALEVFAVHNPQFVILDVMMPVIHGYDVCRELRRGNPELPIMFVSAKTEEVDRVLGLELGADDYLVKPFGVHEVISRIRAITRRCYRRQPEAAGNAEFYLRDVQVFPKELRAVVNNADVELSLRDVKILQLFAQSPTVVLERDEIFNACWGMNYFPNSRTLDQHISKLRKKLRDDPKNPRLIETVHGVGYRVPRLD